MVKQISSPTEEDKKMGFQYMSYHICIQIRVHECKLPAVSPLTMDPSHLETFQQSKGCCLTIGQVLICIAA